MNTHHSNVYGLSEVDAILAAQGLAADTVYQDVIDGRHRFGVQYDNLGVHYYFNNGTSNVACFTPALNHVQVFNPPRHDHMVGEKRYTRRPGASLLPA